MRRAVRSAAKAAFTAADLARKPFVGPRLLIYHQIGADHGKEMDVDPDDFRRHLDHLLASGREIVPLDIAIARRGVGDSSNTVVLTFDDGYADMFTAAFPLLRDRVLPFTVYLTTHPTESGQPLAPGGRSAPMTWRQVEKMADSGLMTLGVHTHTHPDLREVGRDLIEAELDTSDRLIETRLGFRPDHFAYPWGYWSPEAHYLVADRYKSAVLGGGPAIDGDTDPLMLHRIPIQLSDGVVFFRQKLRTGLRTEELVRRRISGYTGP